MQTLSLKSTCNRERLTVLFSAATTRALDTWKFFKAVNWISSVLIAKQYKTFAMK